MKSRGHYHISYVFLCIIFLQGSTLSQTPTPTPETVAVNTPSVSADAEENLIHLGDLIDVDVVGSLDFDWRGTLNPEGFLNGVDFVENPIFALCRSEESIAADVAKAYAKILREPKVVVKILDRSNRPLAFLYGAVKTPQRFQIKRPVALNELLIVAGGLTEKAGGEIQIYRPQTLNCRQTSEQNKSAVTDEEKKEKYITASQDNGSSYINIRISDLLRGKKEANPLILSGDIVTVLEAESIYVIGGVTNPRQISLRTQMTLSRAVASAGGTIKDADPKKIIVYRRESGATKILEADLDKIKKGEVEDLPLKAFDIVEVEQKGREKTKIPPALKLIEMSEKNASNLPLRVID